MSAITRLSLMIERSGFFPPTGIVGVASSRSSVPTILVVHRHRIIRFHSLDSIVDVCSASVILYGKPRVLGGIGAHPW